MTFPDDIAVIDTLLGIPVSDDNSEWYEAFKPLLMDRESREQFAFPVQYMFKDVPHTDGVEDYAAYTVAQMDAHGIAVALTGVDEASSVLTAARRFPGRFAFDYPCNPNAGMEEVRKIRRLHTALRLNSVSVFPCGLNPQVPIDDRRMYPIYATCVELDLPIFVNVGVPGPRVPMAAQHVERVDEVCWFFPELVFVMRHGAEPWQDLAVKLMLKYPNLYYSTSAFAPKHYPSAIIDYANSRGAEKIVYGGYFPAGLSLERIFRELRDVPFKDAVWPKFLRDNAARILKLDPERSGS